MSEKRKTYSITFNKGIDKASLPFEANPARALDALNYVYRDGKVQKRFGINQLVQSEATQYKVYGGADTLKTNSKEINGIWRFLAEDGAYHIVAHIGKLIYEVKESDGVYSLTLLTKATSKAYELENYKSTAIVGNKRLYILGGNKLMLLRFPTVGTYSYEPVEDHQLAYVPTTTISITYFNAKASGRQSLDQVNLMTEWRKNKLLSGVGVSSEMTRVYDANTYGYLYQLDSPIIEKEDGDIEKIRVTINRRKF